MRQFCLVVALMAGAAGSASAQLAVQVPTEKLLVLALTAAPADSATSIALADAVRDRITQLAKYKVLVVTKAKLCEALTASGFPCDVLLDDQQARQLARFLSISAYVTGSLTRQGGTLVANVRVIDIASSGMVGSFSITNPGTIPAFAEAIAQRLNILVRAGEQIRECTTNRQRAAFPRAIAAANKALVTDPTSAGAHLCLATVWEAQHNVDSMISHSEQALKGDPLNGTALENIARGWQQKGDSLKAVDAFIRQLDGDPRNTGRRMSIAQFLRQMKQFPRAVELINAGLRLSPGDQQMLDMKVRTSIEGALWKDAVAGMIEQLAHDSAMGKDTTWLNTAIGAAQSAPDTQAGLRFTEVAVRNFPNNIRFLKARGGALEMAGMVDSALVVYKKTLALEQGNDVTLSLLIAKTIVDHAVYDTGKANPCQRTKDSLCLRALQQAFFERVDSARPFLHPGLVSSDTGQKLTAAVIMLTGGSKMAQANAYAGSYIWLDTLLQVVAPRSPSDTSGPRFQIRVNASFWWGLSSILTLGPVYQYVTKLPATDRTRCDKAKTLVFDRLDRTKAALTLGRRVHPPTADQMLGFVAQYEKGRKPVRDAFKCKNF